MLPELLAIAPANGLIVGGPLSPLKGEGPSNCLTIERQEPWTVEDLAAAYTGHTMTPLALGAAFIAYRNEHGISQMELCRRVGITAGTEHHLESLVRDLAPELQAHLETNRLTFKEARCLADIRDFARQRELAEPFISGRISSVYAERLIKHAKAKPHDDVDTLINAVLSNAKAAVLGKALGLPKHSSRYPVDFKELEAASIALAGRLDAAMAVEVCEYKRLRAAQAVSILYSRAHNLLQKWQFSNHNGNGVHGVAPLS